MQHRILRGTTAMVVALTCGLPAAAQEVGEDGFLGTLTLTAGKRDIATGSAVALTVVDQEEIEDRQASTVAQLIDSVPGVELINGTTPQGSGINIRGYGANTTYGSDQKVAIQIDGASVGSEELYRIGTQLFTDPFLYRSVEVLRGTIGSFEYGSGIVGGVVKLETKDAGDFTGGVPGFRFGQTLEFGSNGSGFTTSTLLAWQPAERVEFLANYTWRTQDDLTDGSGDTIGNSSFTTPSGLLKGKFTFGQDDEHSITLSHSRTKADDKDVPYDQFATSGGMFGNVDRLTDTRQTAIEYRWNPLGNDLIDFSANLSRADQVIDYSYVPGSSPLEGTPTFAFLESTVNAEQRYVTDKLTLKNTALFTTGAVAHRLKAGVEFIHKERADNTAASAPGGEDHRIAAFLIDEMSIGGWTVTPALRYETSEVSGMNGEGTFENDALMGGLALAYDFGNGFSLFGSAAYTEGLPIIDDLGTSASALYKMGTSEKSHTWEIGASYAGTDVFASGDRLAVRGNFYRTEMWDITSYTASGSTSALLDRVETQGFELEASYGLENGLYADLSGHFGTGREYGAGSDTVWRNTPANTVGLTLGKKWDEALDLSWEVVHATNKRDALGADLEDSTVHNLRATFKPQTGAFRDTEIRVGIENAFDLDYVGHLSSSDRPAPGRTFKVTLSKLF
ncbi:TonB-dependent receptor plug domain-containing protein [Salipiger sp.]|uniref:TonB-dependent receptor plug domain-containing protein n=1 Tax=Salipiger sp. TaxID=2078585 RepID=UPI003A97CDE7